MERTQKIFGRVKREGEVFYTSLFDVFTIKKIEQKKIRIVVTGMYKKGIPNNEKSELYIFAQKFFQKYGFSFGVVISIEKNIPPHSGFDEESQYLEILENALEIFSKQTTEALNIPNAENFLRTEENASFLFFPQFKREKKWIESVSQFQQKTYQELVLESFFDIRKIFEYAQKFSPQCLEIVETGPTLFVCFKTSKDLEDFFTGIDSFDEKFEKIFAWK